MNNKYNLVVIGRGLAGHGVISSYLDKKHSQIPSVLWIGKDPLKKANLGCSVNSTAMLARQGIERGISPLGDLLLDSYERAISFVEVNKPDGVVKAARYHIGYDEGSIQKLTETNLGLDN